MKKAAILGERKAGLVDAPDLKPKEDWAVVKVHVAPMCTEYKSFISGKPSEFLGHEAVGEVVDIAQPCRVTVGDRVVVQPQYPCGKCHLCVAGDFIHCQNGYNTTEFLGSKNGTATMAQYVIKPSWLLSPIPDDMSYEHASLALCALGPSFGGCQLMNVSAADTMLVTGLGPVGLGGVVNARFRGARVIAVDMNPWRRQRALDMGAIAAFDPGEDGVVDKIKALTSRNGVDCALDCSGAFEAHKLGLEALRRGGRYSLNAGPAESPVGLGHFIWNGQQLFGAWHYNLSDYFKLLEVIKRSDLLDLLVSHVFPMSKIQEAFETLAGQETAKVLLKPWE